MTKNIGNVDKTFRIIGGLAIISLAFVGPKTAWAWLGLVPLLTASINWCPVYTLLGINTGASSTKPEQKTAES